MTNFTERIPFQKAFPPFVIILFLFIFSYFCFEYKPFEHRFYHSFFKIFSGIFPLPKKLNFDLSIFLTDLCILLISFILLKKEKWKDFFFQEEKKWLTFLTLWATLSIILSPFSPHYDRFIRIIQLFFSLLFYCSIRAYFKNSNFFSILKSIFLILFLVGFLQSVLAISQYFLQDSIGLKKLGEVPGQNVAIVPALKNHKLWIFSFFLKENLTTLIRPCGTFFHPNVLAGFLVLTLLIGKHLFIISKNIRYRLLILFCNIVMFAALIVTYSRAGILAFILGSTVFIALQRKKNLLIFPPLFVAVFSLFINCYITRGGILPFGNEFAKKPDSTRIKNMKIATRMAFAFPISGIGYDHFIHVKEFFKNDIEKKESPDGETVHNIPLLLAAEIGFIGLLFALFFIIQIFVSSIKSPFSPIKITLLSIFVALLVLSMLDYYLLFFQKGKIIFFSFCAFLSVVNKISLSKLEKATEKDSALSYTQKKKDQNVEEDCLIG